MKTLRTRYILLLFVLAVGTAHQLHAQNGCVNSPENPTAVLALLGVLGAGVPALRAKFRSRR